MRKFVLAAFLSLVAVPAHASGGLSCESAGGQVGFEIGAAVTRGMGSPVFNIEGRIDVQATDIGADLAKASFGVDDLAQYWLDGDELRLLLYTERAEDPFASVELTIRTKAAMAEDDEGIYEGEYALHVFESADSGEPKTTDLTGPVKCMVE